MRRVNNRVAKKVVPKRAFYIQFIQNENSFKSIFFCLFVFFKERRCSYQMENRHLGKAATQKENIPLCFGDGTFKKYQSKLVGQVALVMLFLEPYKVIGSPTVEVWQT